MAGMTFDTEHFGNHLQLLACLAEHFETHATTNVRQMSRQMYERSFRANILSGAFDHDVCAAWFVPLGFYLETGEVAWARTIVGFDLPGHLGASSPGKE